ncbi:MAG TPA: VWA domain-containing protein [Thermoanaerobaculia bacterium]|jgi:VWFA-related protein
MIAKKIAALLCLFTLAVSAQQLPRVGETLDVSIVNVDVFVTDRDGNRVRGLTQADFEILENGVRKPISNFAEYSGSGADAQVGVGGPATSSVAPREKRTFLIFFERMQMTDFAADPLFAALKETIKKTVQPGDAVSVVLWSRERTEHFEFTDDVTAINAALDRVAADTQKAQTDVAGIYHEEAAALRAFEASAARMAAGGGGRLAGRRNSGANISPGPMPKMQTDENVEGSGTANIYMVIAYNEMKVRVAAINSAITSMAGIEGKKVLFLAARRLGAVAGAEFAFGNGGSRIAYPIRQRFGTDQMMKSLVDNANASGVTIYPVHPLPIASALPDTTNSGEPDAAGGPISRERVQYLTMLNETTSLSEIAAKTGGLMAAGPQDVVNLLPRIASDVTDYYSLAYRVPSTGGDVVRDLVVRTNKPGLTVRTRRQFVEKSDQTRMRDRLRSTLFRAEQEAPIGITATAGNAKKNGKRVAVPVQIRIPIGALTLLPDGRGKHAGRFSVFVAAAADLDELSDVTEKTQPFDVADAQLDTARAGWFTYDIDVEVNDKSRFVAVGVFDEVSKEYGLARIELPTEGGR